MKIRDNFKILGLVKIPHVLTLLNLIAGILCIFFSMMNQFKIASAFLLLAVFLDFCDGKSARRLNKVTDLGKELDSLCDLVSFGVAPVMFAFNAASSVWGGQTVAVICYILFVCAGALRLARFNITNIKTFEGMPITPNGILVPVVYFLGLINWIPYFLLLSAILMISSFKIKKLW